MRRARHDTPPTFTVTRGGGAGLSSKEARGPLFLVPSPGVRVRVDEVADPEVRVDAALIGCPQDVILTDVSAAWAWGLPLPPWMRDGPSPTSLAVTAGSSHSRRRGVRGRRLHLPDVHVQELDSRKVTTPARTWVDCAAEVPLGHLVAMGDVILRRNLATLDELRRMCHWAYRRRGVKTARLALGMLDPGAESPGESLVRVVLVTGDLPRPRSNVDVYADGTWLARADLLLEEHGVVIEYDGQVHLPEEQRRRDALRRNLLQDAGYFVIVFTGADLKNPERMRALVRRAIARVR